MPPRPIRREAGTAPDPSVFDIDLAAAEAVAGLEPGQRLSPSGAVITPGDGGDVYEFGDRPAAPLTDNPSDPDANLAFQMDRADLDAIADELLDKIAEDKRTCEPWHQTLATGIDLLGVTFEDRTFPFKGASGAYDPLLPEAIYRGYAKARGELLPAAGPVKTQVVGAETGPALDRGARIKAFMNLYLTRLAPEYYPEFDQMLFWLYLAGSTFKKVYQDPIKARPVAPFIMPQKFVVAYGTTSLDSCVRATHEVELSQREVRLRQLPGPGGIPLWLDFDLGDPDGAGAPDGAPPNPVTVASEQAEGVTSQMLLGGRSRYVGDSAWEIPECHVDLDLSSLSNRPDPLVPAGLPVPYRVTIARQSRRILSIQRNWVPGDPMYSKRNWFIHYKLLPGTGFYGFGYAHILGNAARTGTALTRQIIDGATLGMFSGGVRAKGMKLENNNLMIGPCEYPEIDTGGLPLNQAFQPLPVREVSPVSLETLKYVATRAENLANTTDIAVGDGRQDAPVGTTVALQEAANVLTSVMIKNGHVSLRREFEAFYALFGEHLQESPYPFPVRPSPQAPTGMMTIMRADFAPGVEVLPVSDPNITSSSQRMMRSELLSAKSKQAPDLYNRRAVERESLEAMNLSDEKIDQLLPPPQQAKSADPLSENQMALAGQPITAQPWQAHEAHIKVHQELAQLPNMQAHIAQHVAMLMRVKLEAIIGQPLPQGPMPPEIENRIALITAQAMDALKKQEGDSITQDDIIRMEFEKDLKEIASKLEVAQVKAAEGAFKANLDFQSAERDRGVRLRIAQINAASGAADNQNPPPDYVQKIMDIGNKQPPGSTGTGA